MKTSHTFPITVVLLFILAVLLSGCEKSPSRSEKNDSPSPEMLTQITLDEIDADGLTKAVEKHRGKVVLVDFWATWCGPCKTLFPHTIELHNRFPADDLAVITVSLDDREQRDSVLDFLRQKRATTENYLNSIESNAETVEAFEIPNGAIPYLRIYDRTGKNFRVLSGATPAEIEKAVVEAMGNGKAS